MLALSCHCLARQFRRHCRRSVVVALLAFLLVGHLLVSRAGRRESNVDSGILVDSPLGRRISRVQPPAPPPPPTPQQQQQQLSVPKRLHHYFGDSVAIPSQLVQSINSWANHHRDYEVFFWNSAYLEERQLPDLQIYRQYRRCYQAERHTVARLLILITYGGVVLDPDLMSLRDFASFLDGSACVMAQERPEVAALLHGLDELPSLRFAACRPGHPFLRLFLAGFCRLVDGRTGGNASQNAGQTATAVATRAAFDAAVAAYDDDCAERVCDHRDRVVLADAGVFLPVVPAQLLDGLLSRCVASTPVEELRSQACRSLADPANRNLPSVISLAMPLAAGTDDRADQLPLDQIKPSVMGRKPIANFLLKLTART